MSDGAFCGDDAFSFCGAFSFGPLQFFLELL